MTAHKLFVYAFRAFWYGVVPAAFAFGLLTALTSVSSEPGSVLFWVSDQKVPSLIIFFVLGEMIVFRVRHVLPLSGRIGVGRAGRRDVPQELRQEFEESEHLLDEAQRILRRRKASVEREVKASHREKLADALVTLEQTLTAEEFDEHAFTEAHGRAAKLVQQHLKRWRKSELWEYGESIAIAFIVAILLRFFIIEAFKIPTGSMLPTLQLQDHIFVNKFEYGVSLWPFSDGKLFEGEPDYGDIIVFKAPDPSSHGDDYIKRVIARTCDVLDVKDGHPTINGWKVPSCKVGSYHLEGQNKDLYMEFLGEYSYLTVFERHHRKQGPFKARSGEVWVMGDNRDNSHDSREWFGGAGGGVPLQVIKGRALFVWLSFGDQGGLQWSRFFHDVNSPKLPAGAPEALKQGVTRCLAQRPKDTTPPAAPKDAAGQCTYDLK